MNPSKLKALAQDIASLLPNLQTFDGKPIVFDWHADFERRVLSKLEAALADSEPRCSHCKGTKDSPMPLSGEGARCVDKFHWAEPRQARTFETWERSYMEGVREYGQKPLHVMLADAYAAGANQRMMTRIGVRQCW